MSCGTIDYLFVMHVLCLQYWYSAFAYLLALHQEALTAHLIMKPLRLPTFTEEKTLFMELGPVWISIGGTYLDL